MLHPNPFISAFLRVPEWYWKNDLRRWLAFSRFVPDFIQNYSPLKGYERVEKIRKGDIVVDAGAFPGDYTLFAARQTGPQGWVLALEPDPENRALLERHVARSGFTNIVILPLGLWNASTTLSLTSSGVASALSTEKGQMSIPVQPLDNILAEQGLEHVDVVKMDIEGAEIQALEGANKTLMDCRMVCVASYHVVDGEPTLARVEELLRKAGLEVDTGYPKHLTTTGIRKVGQS
jgi:FkbM family methyltransferase